VYNAYIHIQLQQVSCGKHSLDQVILSIDRGACLWR
jgi:hypothetical protein